MQDYFFPPEALVVSPLIPFSPMPGGALTANTQMMRDNGILDKFPEVIKAMEEVVRKGGFGTSVTPVSQFYFQQAFNNVQFGSWKKIADGYGKMVLGYFGKTPVQPDPEVVKIASDQLKLSPTDIPPLERDSQNPKKQLSFFIEQLKENDLPTNDENIFIVATCEDKGIQFLKGNASPQIRKNTPESSMNKQKTNQYSVNLDGRSYEVVLMNDQTISVDGKLYPMDIRESSLSHDSDASSFQSNHETILAPIPGQVMVIKKVNGNKVAVGDVLMILESMKMEIEIKSPFHGTVHHVLVKTAQIVKPDQPLVEIMANPEEVR
jgi:pyruvate carboxylase subunit B